MMRVLAVSQIIVDSNYLEICCTGPFISWQYSFNFRMSASLFPRVGHAISLRTFADPHRQKNSLVSQECVRSHRQKNSLVSQECVRLGWELGK